MRRVIAVLFPLLIVAVVSSTAEAQWGHTGDPTGPPTYEQYAGGLRNPELDLLEAELRENSLLLTQFENQLLVPPPPASPEGLQLQLSDDGLTWESRIAELEAEVARLSGEGWQLRSLMADSMFRRGGSSGAGPNNRAIFPNLTIDSRFVLETEDRDFKLQLDGMVVFRYEVNHQSDDGTGTSGDQHRFNRTGTRVNFRGHVYRDFSYWFRLNFDEDLAFTDTAVVIYHLNEDVNLAFGQFPAIWLREGATTADLLQTVEASATNTVFDPTAYQGVMLGVHLDKLLLRGLVSDGVFSISDVFNNPTEADYGLGGQVGWMLVGDEDDYTRFANFTSRPGSDFAMLLDASFNWQQGSRNIDPTGLKSDLLLAVAQASLEGDGWNLYSGFMYRYTDPSSDGFRAEDYGFVLQGGAWLCEHFEGYSRFDMTIPDKDRPTEGNDFRTFTTGLIYYPFPESDNIKLTTEFLYMPDAESDSIVEPNRFSSVTPAAGAQRTVRVQALLRW